MNDYSILRAITKGKPVAVFGLGVSGLATVRALVSAGVQVFAYDDRAGKREEAQAIGAEIKPLTQDVLVPCALLVLAPGVPLHYPQPHPVVEAARTAGIEILCDIELFYRTKPNGKIVAITGSNGKSTTTALLTHVLKACGVSAVMGGNIGKAVFDLEAPGEKGVYVLELSSYQLDLCRDFAPDIAVLLNLSPDHIDRHGSMKNYIAAKMKIFHGGGVGFLGGDDEYCRALALPENNTNRFLIEAVPEEFQALADVPTLQGRHNIQNALAVLHVTQALGVKQADVIKAIKTYPGLPHRQYPVRRIGRVLYVNDSKGTNAVATSHALAAYSNIYWIVGGLAKEGGLNGLEDYKEKIRHAFVIGAERADFIDWLEREEVPYTDCRDLENAVRRAHERAQKDNQEAVVLLSPACASFDQFPSFDKRGDLFVDLVQALEEGV